MSVGPMTADGDAILLRLRLQPRSSKNKIVGLHGDRIRVCLTAPPVDGKANKECLRFLAKVLGVKQADVSIVSGEKSRNKVVRIAGADLGQISAVLGI